MCRWVGGFVKKKKPEHNRVNSLFIKLVGTKITFR